MIVSYLYKAARVKILLLAFVGGLIAATCGFAQMPYLRKEDQLGRWEIRFNIYFSRSQFNEWQCVYCAEVCHEKCEICAYCMYCQNCKSCEKYQSCPRLATTIPVTFGRKNTAFVYSFNYDFRNVKYQDTTSVIQNILSQYIKGKLKGYDTRSRKTEIKYSTLKNFLKGYNHSVVPLLDNEEWFAEAIEETEPALPPEDTGKIFKPLTYYFEIVTERITDTKYSDHGFYSIQWLNLVASDPEGLLPARPVLAFRYADVKEIIERDLWSRITLGAEKNQVNDIFDYCFRINLRQQNQRSIRVNVLGIEFELEEESMAKIKKILSIEEQMWRE
jgi:hypothetical protein